LADPIRAPERLRLLLLDAEPTASQRLAAELRAREVEVLQCADTPSALRLLRERGAEAVVLVTPLGEADWIAAAAALKEGTAPPVLIVIDGTGHAERMAASLPVDRAPDAVLPRSACAVDVLLEIADQFEVGAPASFPEVLIAMRARGTSGVLEVRGGGVCTRVMLRAGVPVFAEGGALRETLGRMLLRRGALSEAEYLRVIERMTERLIENEATRMGEVLVELGLLTPQDVFDALSAQVREKIIGCFRWTEFEHHFEPLDALPEDVLAYACPPVEALVLAGMREHFDAARIEPLLAPHAGTRARLRRGAEETAVRFQSTPAEQRLLREIGDDATLGAVRAASPLGPLHAGQVIAALLAAQALDLSASPTAPPPANESGPARPLRPQVAPQPVRTETPRRVVQTLGPAATSLVKLRRQLARSGRPAPVSAPDERSARIEGERAFRQGIQLLAQSAFAAAQKAFAVACERNGDEPEYHMFEAWTQVLSVKDEEARSVARAQTTAWARKLLERDRDSLRAHTILGNLVAAAGDLEAAERHFRHALRVAPEDRDALQGIRLVDRRRRAAPAPAKSAKPKRR
jgi:ActR/RegA family two-component response regulator/tetratricopeptide (TPR) repeat protein